MARHCIRERSGWMLGKGSSLRDGVTLRQALQRSDHSNQPDGVLEPFQQRSQT